MDLQFTAAQIAQMIKGTVEGDENVVVNYIARIEDAKFGQMAFFANLKYEEYLYSTQASIVLINNDFVLKQPVTATLIRVKDAYQSFAQLLQIYEQMVSKKPEGIQDPIYKGTKVTLGNGIYIGAFSYLSNGVTIGDNTIIHPQVYLGNKVTIGKNCVINAGVKIYHNCRLGDNVIIHAGAIIGGDGFGFAPQADGSLSKVPQLGNVIIEDDVEIGANTTIDRATLGSTIIRKGAKLDNLIQIAHNVEVGERTVIAAQAGVSGSTKIGKQAMIGGQAGIVGHITLADGTKINAQSGVSKSVKKENIALTGSPAHDYSAMLRAQAVFRTLPEMEKKLKELEKELESLRAASKI
jgi:UDP-3-O-[3-hydroxymyristoyl] glucosamine N-acyltransferase